MAKGSTGRVEGRNRDEEGRRGKEETQTAIPARRDERRAGAVGRAIDPSLHVVVKDELRVQILAMAIQRLYSPSEFARDVDIPINSASAIISKPRVKHGFLELVKIVKVRGANKHMYRATKSGFIGTPIGGRSPRRCDPESPGRFSKISSVGESGRSTAALMSSRDTACLYWAPRDLDEIAWERAGVDGRVVDRRIRSAWKGETVQRRAEGKSAGSFQSTFAIAAFPSPTHEVKSSGTKRRRRRNRQIEGRSARNRSRPASPRSGKANQPNANRKGKGGKA